MAASIEHADSLVAHITPDEDHLEGNPYRAIVAFEEDFLSAEVRIEPPVQNTDGFLELFTEGSDATHVVTTAEATILHVTRNDYDSENRIFSDKDWTKYTVEQMLNELGRAASAHLFTRNYETKG